MDLEFVLFFVTCSNNNSAKGGGSAKERTLVIKKTPFHGIIFIVPNVIDSSDTTTSQKVSYEGQKNRTIYDWRIGHSIAVNSYTFKTSFSDGLMFEVWVNSEFSNSYSALNEARKFSKAIGKLPTALRKDVKHIINKGVKLFGGGNEGLLIHTGQAKKYEKNGILIETLVHEATHTSLDPHYSSSPGWLAVQKAGCTVISTHAHNHSGREDMAESFLPYIAIRYRSDRIPKSLADTIRAAISNRIAYFVSLTNHINMTPFKNKILTNISYKLKISFFIQLNNNGVRTD